MRPNPSWPTHEWPDNSAVKVRFPGRVQFRNAGIRRSRSVVVESPESRAESSILRADMRDFVTGNCIYCIVWLETLNSQLWTASFRLKLPSRALLVVLFFVGSFSSLQAMIFYSTADPNYNTTAPTGMLANSGWQWVGVWRGLSGRADRTQTFYRRPPHRRNRGRSIRSQWRHLHHGRGV